jgi:hypothetical protein
LNRIATPVVQLRARFPRKEFTRASVATRIDTGAIVVVAVAVFALFANAVTANKIRRFRQAGVIDGIQNPTHTVSAGVVLINGALRENSFVAINSWPHHEVIAIAILSGKIAVAVVHESEGVAKLVSDERTTVNSGTFCHGVHVHVTFFVANTATPGVTNSAVECLNALGRHNERVRRDIQRTWIRFYPRRHGI